MANRMKWGLLIIQFISFTSCSEVYNRDIGDDSDNSNNETNITETETAAELLSSIIIGWNLGNSFDAQGSETAWGNPVVTRELIQTVKDNGFDAIRMPVTWSPHLGESPDFTIDVTWLSRVEEVVSWIIDEGLYIIINIHHDGADAYTAVEWLSLNDESGDITEEHNQVVENQFIMVWRQIAERFQNYNEHLIFESMNEIHDGYGTPNPLYFDIINNLNQVFVDTVRSTGGFNNQRVLIVPGYNTNIDYTIQGFELPDDSINNRLALTVHFYDPWSYAGAAETHVWGTDNSGSDSWGQEDFVDYQFNRLKSEYIDSGIPVIIGEYGAVQQDGYEEYREYYMDYVTKAAYDRGITPFYWDNGASASGPDGFGLINRYNYNLYYPEIIESMINAVSDN